MVQLCRYIHPGGHQCNSPALRNQSHCHFHAGGRQPAGPRHSTTRPGYRWYTLQRQAHLLKQSELPLVLTEICRAIVVQKISRRRTRKLLKAIDRRNAQLQRDSALNPME